MTVSHNPELEKLIHLREKIAAGMTSLRAGKGTDGEAFLAAMEVELAELERREPV